MKTMELVRKAMIMWYEAVVHNEVLMSRFKFCLTYQQDSSILTQPKDGGGKNWNRSKQSKKAAHHILSS